MAYIDTMTGLGNRTAFLEENKSNAIFPGMISYIMMDANNLKTINDTFKGKVASVNKEATEFIYNKYANE